MGFRDKDSTGVNKMKANELGGKLAQLMKNKYILIVLAAGLLLILLPTGKGGSETPEPESAGITAPGFSLGEQERRLAQTLSEIEGAGKVSVMLSLKSGVSQELAVSGDELLVISAGSGTESAVPLAYIYPEYQGALVVCAGADNAGVRLAVTRAVASVTGLGSDKITVIKMK